MFRRTSERTLVIKKIYGFKTRKTLHANQVDTFIYCNRLLAGTCFMFDTVSLLCFVRFAGFEAPATFSFSLITSSTEEDSLRHVWFFRRRRRSVFMDRSLCVLHIMKGCFKSVLGLRAGLSSSSLSILALILSVFLPLHLLPSSCSRRRSAASLEELCRSEEPGDGDGLAGPL